MDGHTLGVRASALYIDDAGNSFSITTALAFIIATNDSVDATNPSLPKRFQPRGVWCQRKDGATVFRKFVPVGTPGNPIYSGNARQQIEIDGQTFVTTGRVGERVSFPGG